MGPRKPLYTSAFGPFTAGVLHGRLARLTHLMMLTISSTPITNMFWRIRLCAASLCIIHEAVDGCITVDVDLL